MPGPPGRWWNSSFAAQKLALNSDQQKRMDDIFQQNRLRLIDLNAALQKEEIILEPLVSADQPDETRILGQIDKVAQARAELEKANARFLFALRAKLTPDQWKQVQEFRQNHEGMRGMRRGGEGGQPGNGGDRRAPGPPAGSPSGPQGMLDDGGPGENSPTLAVNQ